MNRTGFKGVSRLDENKTRTRCGGRPKLSQHGTGRSWRAGTSSRMRIRVASGKRLAVKDERTEVRESELEVDERVGE